MNRTIRDVSVTFSAGLPEGTVLLRGGAVELRCPQPEDVEQRSPGPVRISWPDGCAEAVILRDGAPVAADALCDVGPGGRVPLVRGLQMLLHRRGPWEAEEGADPVVWVWSVEVAGVLSLESADGHLEPDGPTGIALVATPLQSEAPVGGEPLNAYEPIDADRARWRAEQGLRLTDLLCRTAERATALLAQHGQTWPGFQALAELAAETERKRLAIAREPPPWVGYRVPISEEQRAEDKRRVEAALSLLGREAFADAFRLDPGCVARDEFGTVYNAAVARRVMDGPPRFARGGTIPVAEGVATEWACWKADHVDSTGRLPRRPHWRTTGQPWELVRDDGVLTGHKHESPFSSWRETVEQSMEVYDRVLPIGRREAWPAELAAAVRDGRDIDFGAVYTWDLRQRTAEQFAAVGPRKDESLTVDVFTDAGRRWLSGEARAHYYGEYRGKIVPVSEIPLRYSDPLAAARMGEKDDEDDEDDESGITVAPFSIPRARGEAITLPVRTVEGEALPPIRWNLGHHTHPATPQAGAFGPPSSLHVPCLECSTPWSVPLATPLTAQVTCEQCGARYGVRVDGPSVEWGPVRPIPDFTARAERQSVEWQWGRDPQSAPTPPSALVAALGSDWTWLPLGHVLPAGFGSAMEHVGFWRVTHAGGLDVEVDAAVVPDEAAARVVAAALLDAVEDGRKGFLLLAVETEQGRAVRAEVR